MIRGLLVAAILTGCGGSGLSQEELDWCNGTTSGMDGPGAVMQVALDKGRDLDSDSYYNEETGEYTAAYIEDCREAFKRFGRFR